jgi:hypothetical protein
MIRRKLFGTAMAMGIATLLAASAVATPARLVPIILRGTGPVPITLFGVSIVTFSITLKGVGPGALSAGACTKPEIACETGHICECLTGDETVLGNQGFNNGSLVFSLSIDKTSASLPISNQGSCLPATGLAMLSNTTGKLTVSMDVSGLACPTADGAAEVFNGTYFVTGGTAPGDRGAFTTGTGTFNDSLAGSSARTTLGGYVQKMQKNL